MTEQYPTTREGMIARGMIPLKPKGDPYSDKVRAEPRIRRERYTNAQKLRRLLEKNNTKSEMKDKIMNFIDNPKENAAFIIAYMFDVIEQHELTASNKIKLLKVMGDLYRNFHGSKLELSEEQEQFDAKIKAFLSARNKSLPSEQVYDIISDK